MSRREESKQGKNDVKPTEEEFVNDGLEKWESIRAKWIEPIPEKCIKRKGEVRAKSVDVDDVIERIYSQTGNGTLREPLPLGQMIDLLIDFWEADGLYD
mmetsp:Transcript_43526/g.86497  ORF Transcript_43526/g.86497 Transcript_43526/m.86497 type:complete len:99 (-) Transcript_43526:193-489(-)|eukprot:CAMPEP_0170407664 /NCGR_PEP_ID=MMETSP0117_2-20130122/28366_1 /TAXON_ID=400756 /ORGANISM="Durinskia baltica, Strain CSIRO CS-38" /LENGTH=98 /DNA_ID=CAMNT_0010664923 /DNA_START=170 /DNA_END=466 /DNA_ORIENTATION=-